MSSTSERAPASGATCSASLSGECDCGGGCESQLRSDAAGAAQLPETLRAATAVGCTISAADAPEQLARVERLRPHVIGIERRPGSLAISLDRTAENDVISRFIEVEEGCCSFLRIDREQTSELTRVIFSTDERDREPALAAIARMFDPGEPPTAHASTGPADRPRNTALLGVLGIACLACFLPAVLAAGAAGSIAAALGGATGMAVVLAIVAVATAAALVVHRRSRRQSCGC